MDDTVNQSTKGIEAIKSVEQTFNDIQSSINGVTKQIKEVSSDTLQMNDAIEQISSNINDITSISTETAFQTQEVSSCYGRTISFIRGNCRFCKLNGEFGRGITKVSSKI